MDGVSAAASIVGIATAGIQISIKVVTLASQVSTAADRISSIGSDVSLTSAILHQLGELMNQKTTNDELTIFSKGGLETTRSSAEICQRVFQEVEKETAKASEVIRGRKQRIGEKVKLSMREKAKWPFLQPGLEILRTDLREAKGTLMLMLQVANLALSKRVAALNASLPSSTSEQQDLVRSILALQQQQQQVPHRYSVTKANYHASPRKSGLEAPQVSEEPNPTTPTSIGHAKPRAAETALRDGAPSAYMVEEDSCESGRLSPIETNEGGHMIGMGNYQETKSQVDVSESTERLPPVALGASPPFKANSTNRSPEKSSPVNRASQSRDWTDDSRNVNDTKTMELRMYSLHPNVEIEFDEVVISWVLLDIRIADGEMIRKRLTSKQSDGLNSALENLEGLHPSELSLVTRQFEQIEQANCEGRVTLLSLKRTGQDLQQGNIVLKNIPSFQLIFQLDDQSNGRRHRQKSGQRKKINLSRPTYIKVHRKHLSPETLDEYELPWEWDTGDSDYIIIKRWIPESDQDILFEHTRSLREKRKQKDEVVELKRERDNLLLMRKKSRPEKRRPSRNWMFGDDEDERDNEWDGDQAGRRGEAREKAYSGHSIQPAERFEQPISPSSSDDGTESLERRRPKSSGDSLPVVVVEEEYSSSEDQHGDSAEGSPLDEMNQLDAVNKLLEKYTTLFEQTA